MSRPFGQRPGRGGMGIGDAGLVADLDIPVVVALQRPVDGDIVVATVHGERSLKRLRMTGGRPRLMFENSDMPLFDLPEIAEVEIWGVALCNVHWLRPRKQG